MEIKLVKRNALGLAQEILQYAPVLTITGARQTGKSTLMGLLLSGTDAHKVNLDSQLQRMAAQNDPEGFVLYDAAKTFAIDEVQRVPELILAIKNELEKDRRPGRFVLIGSSNLAV